ncbi:formylglycine-generating enzyme family protein [Agrococcus casei]|uniref:formylglycine-generating enzyme family protein n=1 Tax=Agrococcus casei TaxID=343512 RepID=UPI003F93E2F8
MGAFVRIPADVVHLADARRATERSVRLLSFQVATTTVTADDFAAGRFLAAGAIGGAPASGVSWREAVSWCNRASEHDGLEPAYVLAGETVHWNPASDGYRLPTEAEWVLASKGGVDGPRYGALRDIGWTAADGVLAPQPVAQKRANAYGVFDVLGNVWEWCWDRLDPARYGDYRVFKGGGWADPEWSCRVGVRRGNAPDAVVDDVGFRVVRGVVAAESGVDGGQGWSESADRARASLSEPLPVGWTPLP